jgi:hypothetical protein
MIKLSQLNEHVGIQLVCGHHVSHNRAVIYNSFINRLLVSKHIYPEMNICNVKHCYYYLILTLPSWNEYWSVRSTSSHIHEAIHSFQYLEPIRVCVCGISFNFKYPKFGSVKTRMWIWWSWSWRETRHVLCSLNYGIRIIWFSLHVINSFNYQNYNSIFFYLNIGNCVNFKFIVFGRTKLESKKDKKLQRD